MFNKLNSVLILSLSLSVASPISATSKIDRGFDEFEKPERHYLTSTATLGITAEGYLPITIQSRRDYKFGMGIGINVEFHPFYPISYGLNFRISKVSLDRSARAFILRTVGATLRLFLTRRGDDSPYLRLGIGKGDAKVSSSYFQNSSGEPFTSGEIGAGYMMRLGSRSWIRFESVYTSNFTPGVIYYSPVYNESGNLQYFTPVSYDLKGLTMRVEAGIVTW